MKTAEILTPISFLDLDDKTENVARKVSEVVLNSVGMSVYRWQLKRPHYVPVRITNVRDIYSIKGKIGSQNLDIWAPYVVDPRKPFGFYMNIAKKMEIPDPNKDFNYEAVFSDGIFRRRIPEGIPLPNTEIDRLNSALDYNLATEQLKVGVKWAEAISCPHPEFAHLGSSIIDRAIGIAQIVRQVPKHQATLLLSTT